MRIVIDLQGAQSENRFRGIGRYSLALAQGMARLRGEHEVLIALNGAFQDSIDPIRAAFAGLLPAENIRVWFSLQQVAAVDPANQTRRVAAENLREQFLMSLQPDWVVVSSLFEGFGNDAVTSLLRTLHQKTAVVLYDLIPWIHEKIYLTNDRVRPWYHEKLDHLRRADLLLSISASSGREAVDYLGFEVADVVNISTAADTRFLPHSVTAEERARLGSSYRLQRSFIMYTGGIDHRKNIEGLLAAWAQVPITLRQRHQLAIVCSIQPQDRQRLTQLAADLGLSDEDVCLTGFVSDDDLLLLYNACELFVFPSWHEGFGLPILEAMQCGKPVLAANRSSLPEVVGRDDALFDPFDLNDMAARIERALTEPHWRGVLAQHGLQQAQKFSWDVTAGRAWKALMAHFPSGPPVVLAATSALKSLFRRPKLALVSPLPPERSGIADYSAELLRDLTRWYDIDVVVKDPVAMNDDYVRANCGVRSINDFRASASSYERILYHFGNSEFHEHMFDLLMAHPGVVVLHDFFLSGIQAWSEAHRWRSYAWAQALYASHGYLAVAERYGFDDEAEVIYRYPANLPVLQQALGVIVHSHFNTKLADTWYGEGAAKDWAVIPLLRVPEIEVDRDAARQRLGLAQNALVVCSFGMLGQTKLNHRLLDAWLGSSLAGDLNAYLIFVGLASGGYGERIAHTIQASGCAERIQITGWVNGSTYRDWLTAANVAVQLRTLSRGETSAAILDCLNYGLATVVNANGSIGELDPNAAWLLPDEFSDAELQNALETLTRNRHRQAAQGRNGRDLIRTHHNPRLCAAQYCVAIEKFHQRALRDTWGATQQLAAAPPALWPQVATCLARNHPPHPRKRQLLVDISELVQRDARSGIQRVVRSILSEWLSHPPAGFVVEPVYATANSLGYCYARRFTSVFMEIWIEGWTEDEPVEVWPGDVFCGLDLQPAIIPIQQPVWQEWRRRGVKVGFVLYDLLPMLLPRSFIEGAALGFARWLSAIATGDFVIAISKSVANEFRAWLNAHNPQRTLPLQLCWFHLGADIECSKPTSGLPADAPQVLARLAAAPSFLMVGTLEGRKGHAQTLSAFETLWHQGVDINLVIVGKAGWLVEDVVDRLCTHVERGQRLFWLEGISDEYLQKIYGVAAACIMASQGEGYGLPIIEASRHELPILARDLPVFHEVAGAAATYFSDDINPHTIAAAVSGWLVAQKEGRNVPSKTIQLSWKESAAQLLDCMLQNARCEPWQTKHDATWRFWGNDIRLNSEVGHRHGQVMSTTGKAGFLIFGPFIELAKGRYKVVLCGAIGKNGAAGAHMDVVVKQGSVILGQSILDESDQGGRILAMVISLDKPCTDLEVRILVNDDSELQVSMIEIAPWQGEQQIEQVISFTPIPVESAQDVIKIELEVKQQELTDSSVLAKDISDYAQAPKGTSASTGMAIPAAEQNQLQPPSNKRTLSKAKRKKKR